MRKFWTVLFCALFLVTCGSACPQTQAANTNESIQSSPATASESTAAAPKSIQAAASDKDPAVQEERDTIYSLLAYAVVLKDWQTAETNPARGHNIGSVLVTPKGEVVAWARNCNKITGNGTQHGEVRLMRNYLAEVKTYDLKGYVVYTTLEPCAMCSGMMVLLSIGRTVYGQTDPDYGKAIERLKLDSSKLSNGYKPYPRTENLISEPAANKYREQLDAEYKKYQATDGKGITKWLLSDDAKEIYKEAEKELRNFQIRHEENKEVYKAALEFYKYKVSKHYIPDSEK
jgi:tRNA(adenine34) deaminase